MRILILIYLFFSSNFASSNQSIFSSPFLGFFLGDWLKIEIVRERASDFSFLIFVIFIKFSSKGFLSLDWGFWREREIRVWRV